MTSAMSKGNLRPNWLKSSLELLTRSRTTQFSGAGPKAKFWSLNIRKINFEIQTKYSSIFCMVKPMAKTKHSNLRPRVVLTRTPTLDHCLFINSWTVNYYRNRLYNNAHWRLALTNDEISCNLLFWQTGWYNRLQSMSLAALSLRALIRMTQSWLLKLLGWPVAQLK